MNNSGQETYGISQEMANGKANPRKPAVLTCLEK
jgi:hypothetical protein